MDTAVTHLAVAHLVETGITTAIVAIGHNTADVGGHGFLTRSGKRANVDTPEEMATAGSLTLGLKR